MSDVPISHTCLACGTRRGKANRLPHRIQLPDLSCVCTQHPLSQACLFCGFICAMWFQVRSLDGRVFVIGEVSCRGKRLPWKVSGRKALLESPLGSAQGNSIYMPRALLFQHTLPGWQSLHWLLSPGQGTMWLSEASGSMPCSGSCVGIKAETAEAGSSISIRCETWSSEPNILKNKDGSVGLSTGSRL